MPQEQFSKNLPIKAFLGTFWFFLNQKVAFVWRTLNPQKSQKVQNLRKSSRKSKIRLCWYEESCFVVNCSSIMKSKISKQNWLFSFSIVYQKDVCWVVVVILYLQTMVKKGVRLARLGWVQPTEKVSSRSSRRWRKKMITRRIRNVRTQSPLSHQKCRRLFFEILKKFEKENRKILSVSGVFIVCKYLYLFFMPLKRTLKTSRNYCLYLWLIRFSCMLLDGYVKTRSR